MDSEDADQSGRMRWLILVFAGRASHIVSFVVRWLNYFYICPEKSRKKKSPYNLFDNEDLPLGKQILSFESSTLDRVGKYFM